MYKLIAYDNRKRRVLAWSKRIMRLYQIRKRWPNVPNNAIAYVHVVHGSEEVA